MKIDLCILSMYIISIENRFVLEREQVFLISVGIEYEKDDAEHWYDESDFAYKRTNELSNAFVYDLYYNLFYTQCQVTILNTHVLFSASVCNSLKEIKRDLYVWKKKKKKYRKS